MLSGEQPNASAVAAAAGVSRPTPYAPFLDHNQLLEALVERAVRRTMAAIESAQPESGPALDALQRADRHRLVTQRHRV